MQSDWCAEDALRKWCVRNMHPIFQNNNIQPVKIYTSDDEITVEIIEETLIKAARLVRKRGPSYMDIFVRLEDELKKARECQAIEDRISALLDQPSSPILKAIFSNQVSFCAKLGPLP